MTFAMGGIQVWMPTFLSRARGYSLESANFMFGIIIVVDGIVASLAGGMAGRLSVAAHEGILLPGVGGEHGSGRAVHDRGPVYSRASDGASDRGLGIFSFVEHLAAECGGH